MSVAPWLLLALYNAALVVFGGAPEDARTPDATRHVPLVGQPNFRDLGGYRTSDGRAVRQGLIYRSGELGQLTTEDVAELDRRGIRTVVDFRSESEVESRGVDRLPEGARYLPLRIDHGDLGPVLMAALGTGDASRVPSHVLAEANRALVRNATAQYGALLHALSAADQTPLVFHCTHGKDRAGVAAAVLLLALGVPVETARADYLLSNVYRKEENERDLRHIREGVARRSGVSPEDVDLSRLEELFWLRDSYFDAVFSEIESVYGTFTDYLERGLGLDDAGRQALRARFTA